MNILKKIFALLLISIVAFSCSNDEGAVNPDTNNQEIISYRNMRGAWELTSLNGVKIAGDAYFHIEFSLEDDAQKFEVQTNLNSAFASKSTGVYLLEENDDRQMIISGIFDNQFSKPWDSEYIISSFTKTEMVWVDTLTEEIRLYTRIVQ